MTGFSKIFSQRYFSARTGLLLPVTILFFLFCGTMPAQEFDITPYIRSVEDGNEELVRHQVDSLIVEHPNSPSVLYLDAFLTLDGAGAVEKYKALIEKYPASKHSDAATYRIYCYYYAIGSYQTAQKYKNQLLQNFPESDYALYVDESRHTIEKKEPPDVPNTDAVVTEPPKEETRYTKHETPPEKETPKKTGNYFVQVGSFLKEQNAKDLVKRLSASGYEPSIRKKTIGGSEFNVVVIAGFKLKEEASATVERLQREFSIEGIVQKEQQ